MPVTFLAWNQIQSGKALKWIQISTKMYLLVRYKQQTGIRKGYRRLLIVQWMNEWMNEWMTKQANEKNITTNKLTKEENKPTGKATTETNYCKNADKPKPKKNEKRTYAYQHTVDLGSRAFYTSRSGQDFGHHVARGWAGTRSIGGQLTLHHCLLPHEQHSENVQNFNQETKNRGERKRWTNWNFLTARLGK